MSPRPPRGKVIGGSKQEIMVRFNKVLDMFPFYLDGQRDHFCPFCVDIELYINFAQGFKQELFSQNMKETFLYSTKIVIEISDALIHLKTFSFVWIYSKSPMT